MADRMTMPGDDATNRPARARSHSTIDRPAMVNPMRTDDSIATSQGRGRNQDGKKCLSSQGCLAKTAHSTSSVPTEAMVASATARLSERRAADMNSTHWQDIPTQECQRGVT